MFVKVREMKGISAKKYAMISLSAAVLAASPAVMDGILPWTGASVAWAAPFEGQYDAGAQLNRAREYMDRQLTEQRMEEDLQKKKAQVETNVKQQPEESVAKVEFNLSRVNVDPSEVLSEAEIQKVIDPYIGKKVTLADLYAITGAINNLYVDKGYMVCKAYLPPQRIHEGAVQIKLLEGKTGLVTVQGLKHTREGYVKSRIPLKPEKVANTAVLNKQLQRFNATNDVQLRIAVHAGEKPGTTDYEIVAYEPKQNQSVTLYLDNNGYETSGRFRQGIFYNLRSLTGIRDSLRLSYLRSRGTNVYSAGYSVPISKMGTRLDLDYSGNTTKIVKGPLKDQNIKGRAHALGLTLRHPIRVDGNHRDEVGLQYLNQKSVTDWGPIRWTNDKRNTFIPYISFTTYGNSSIFYHKHSIPFTKFDGESFGGNFQRNSNYMSYQLNMLYQKKYKHGQMFSARLDGQLAGNKDRSSADRFYLGGVSSVRGYEESFIGGNKGVTVGLTYQTPLNKKQTLHAFTFFDYGWVKDDIDLNASSYSLYSTGVGLSATYKNLYASLTLGIPLKRSYEFTTEKVDNTRFDFVCSATF